MFGWRTLLYTAQIFLRQQNGKMLIFNRLQYPLGRIFLCFPTHWDGLQYCTGTLQYPRIIQSALTALYRFVYTTYCPWQWGWGGIKYCRNEGEFISSEFPLRSLEWYPLGCRTMYVLHGTLTKGILCLVWVEHWKASN